MEPGASQFPLKVVIMEAASWLRDYITAIKNGRLHPFSVVERKARAATRSEPWGPSGTMLAELAELSNDQEHCEVIFAVLEYRIRSPEAKWLCIYKALQVLEYLLQRGSLHCINAAQELVVPLAALQNFSHIGLDRRDHGKSVRLRAEAVKALILDAEGLQKKRAQLAARAADMKFSGYSREDAMAAAAAAAAAGGKDSTGMATTACTTATWSATSSPGGPMTPAPMLMGSAQGYAGGGGGSNGGGTASSTPLRALALTAPLPGSVVQDGGLTSPTSYRPPSLFLTAPGMRLGNQSASTPSLRNAGETKGVTFEQNKRQLEQLRQLTLLEDNRICADCASNAAAARPSWASINLGVLICMRCAGIHRGLGVHISKVRSTTLDTWLPEQVENMARLGNRRANAHFEATLDPALRPSRENIQDLERFIRLKYADKVWAAKGPWPPEEDTVTPSAAAAAATKEAHAAFAKHANVTAVAAATPCCSPSPPPPPPLRGTDTTLPGSSSLPSWGSSAVWPSSCSPPDSGTAGGGGGGSGGASTAGGGGGAGFGDSPPTWPSASSALTTPHTTAMQIPSRTTLPPPPPPVMAAEQEESLVSSRLGRTTMMGTGTRQNGSGSAIGCKSPQSSAVVRLLPPPPAPPSSSLPFGTGLGAAASAAAVGTVPARATASSTSQGGNTVGSGAAAAGPCATDLLQLDSEDDGEEEEDDGVDGGSGGRGEAGGSGDGTGAPGTGSTALWDLLDLNLDVMTWLERTEGSQPQLQPHERKLSAPVSGTATRATAPAPTAGTAAPAAAGRQNSSAANNLSFGASTSWGPAAPLISNFGTNMGTPGATVAAAGGGVTRSGSSGGGGGGGGGGRLGVAESVILTSEFPVYDLLTPLPTGGGMTAPSGPASALGWRTAVGSGSGAAAAATHPVATPPLSSLSPQIYPQQQSPPRSAPLQPMVCNRDSHPSPLGGGSAAAATASTAPVTSPPSTTAVVHQPSATMQPAGQSRSGMRMGVGVGIGMRAVAAQGAAAAAPGPAMDLDNMLAMHLNTLDISLANVPTGSVGLGVGGGSGGARPSWQPAAAAVGGGGGMYSGIGAGGGRR